jgi:hypothetical protein
MSLQQKVNTALNWLYEKKGVKAHEILAQAKSCGANIYQSQLSKAYTIKVLVDNEVNAKPITTPLGQGKLKVIWDFLKKYLESVHEVTIVDEGNVLFKDSKGKKVELIKVKGGEKKKLPHETPYCEEHQDLDFGRLYGLIRKAKKIDILVTYFTGLDQLLEQFEFAIIQNKCKIRVLMLDPHRDIIRVRAKALSNLPGENPVRTLSDQVEKLKAFKNRYPVNFESRLYNEIPASVYYRMDETLFIGSIWTNKHARKGAFHEYGNVCKSTSPYAKDNLENWQSTWEYAGELEDKRKYTLKYDCFVGLDNKLCKNEFMVNPKNDAVWYFNKINGQTYYGTLYKEQNGATLVLYAESATLSPMVFQFEATLMDPETQSNSMVTGIYNVGPKLDRYLLSRRFVLIKQEFDEAGQIVELDKRKQRMLSQFLQYGTMKNIHVTNWRAMKTHLDEQKQMTGESRRSIRRSTKLLHFN